MADAKITDLTALAGASIASGDELVSELRTTNALLRAPIVRQVQRGRDGLIDSVTETRNV